MNEDLKNKIFIFKEAGHNLEIRNNSDKKVQFMATIGQNWKDGPTGGFSQIINIDGILEEDSPIINVLLDDDTTNKKTVNFNPEVSTEQLISACVSSYDRTPESTESKFIKSVTVSLEYNYNENIAFFDNMQLSLDDGGKDSLLS